MFKKIYLAFIFMLSIIALCSPFKMETVSAKDTSRGDGIPYETYTLGVNNALVPTQTAYIPYGILNQNESLKNPKDIYLYDDMVYVADSGNKRIVVFNKQGESVQVIEHEKLVEPSGVFVNDEYLYVADPKAQLVVAFDHNGNLVKEYTRPTEPLFGKSTRYQPIKIAVNSSGYMYIVGEGSTNGLITLNKEGEFMGYVGINNAAFSLRKYLYNLFVQDSSLASTRASAPTNVAIGSNGNIYTTNININETFKRLNISGSNTLDANTYYPSETIADIAISKDNYTYLCTVDGKIYEYDIKGNLLFVFSSKDVGGLNVFGLTEKLSGIEIDDNGNIYVLDEQDGRIQMYQRAGFVNVLHKAVDLYNDGQYLQSKDLWKEILKQNTNFALAHTALGYAYFKEGNNKAALEEFKASRNYVGYSQVYWEIRNSYLQNYTGSVIVILLALLIVLKVAKKIMYSNAVSYNGKMYPVFVKNIKEKYDLKKKSKVELRLIKLKHELDFSLKIFKRPVDLCYGIKKENKASYLSAITILITFVVVYILDKFASGFLFRQVDGNIIKEVAIVLAIFMLWCTVNYLVSTLQDGEGWFKDFFIASCYMLIPFILIKIPFIIISHFLTLNEVFIYSFSNFVIYAYTIILIIIIVQNTHNYTFKQTLKNILITLFGMVIIALMLFLVYMFMSQLFDFVISLVKEVIFRG